MQRIQKEFKEVSDPPLEGVSVQLVNQNIFQWHAILVGPENTPYAGGKFHLDITIPTNYPFHPPEFLFKTKIYHPSVNEEGKVCKEIGGDWNPKKKIKEVLQTIMELIKFPDVEVALMPSISEEFKKNRAKFDATAKEWTRKFASS